MMIEHILSDFLDWGLLRLLCDLTWGPPAEFGVNALAGSKSNVRGLLKSYGVRSWGYHYSGGNILGGIVKLLIDRFLGPKIIASTKEDPQPETAGAPMEVAKELLFSVNKKKARWTLKVLEMHHYPVTRVPRVALQRKKRTKKWRL